MNPNAVVAIGVRRCGVGGDDGARHVLLSHPESLAVKRYLTSLFVIQFLDSSTLHCCLLS